MPPSAPALKRQIEDAANKSGRSQAQELELIIQREFDRRALLPEMLETVFGPCDAAILLAFAEVMKLAGRAARFAATESPGTDWFDVPAAYEQVRQGLVQIFDAIKPEGDSTIEPKFSV